MGDDNFPYSCVCFSASHSCGVHTHVGRASWPRKQMAGFAAPYMYLFLLQLSDGTPGAVAGKRRIID